MSIINCKECGKEISGESICCPHCGIYIQNDMFENPVIREEGSGPKVKKHIFAWIVCICTVLFSLLFLDSVGSCICIWLAALFVCPIVIKFLDKKCRVKVKPIIQVIIWVICIFIALLLAPSPENSETLNPEENKVIEEPVEDSQVEQPIENEDEDNKIEVEEPVVENEEVVVENEDKVTGEVTQPQQPSNTPSNVEQQEPVNTPTAGEQNALNKAKSYLNFTAFSRNGLINQLEFEGFSNSEAVYGVDNCGANWNEQALKKAQSYLSLTAFSRTGLIGQLEFEGFSNSEAVYAVDNCGANWKEQAAKKVQSYVSLMSFPRDALIQQLEFEGFTSEEAEYGVTSIGY